VFPVRQAKWWSSRIAAGLCFAQIELFDLEDTDELPEIVDSLSIVHINDRVEILISPATDAAPTYTVEITVPGERGGSFTVECHTLATSTTP